MVAGKYRVEELIRSGPEGVVLAVRHALLRRPATLEILTAYTDGLEAHQDRRVHAARRAARLRTPHVVRVLDIGLTDDATPYIATERVVGASLAREVEERERLPVAEACRWVLEACAGLAEAHALGLVHGGLRPEKLLLAEPPDSAPGATPERVLKITDFGSACELDALDDANSATLVGSPGFLAPEQVQGAHDVDARADVWALGAILYRLVSGTLPFAAETAPAMLVAIVLEVPAVLTGAPFELAQLVTRCLDKDPSKRPADVAELARGLAPFAGARGARLAELAQAALAGKRSGAAGAAGAAADEKLAVTASGSIAPVSMPATVIDPDVDSDVLIDDGSEAPLPLVARSPGGIAALIPRGERDRPTTRILRPARAPRSERTARGARAGGGGSARAATAAPRRSSASTTALVGGAIAMIVGALLPFVVDEGPRAHLGSALRFVEAASSQQFAVTGAATGAAGDPEVARVADAEVPPFVPHGEEPPAALAPAPIPTPTPLVVPPSTAWRDPPISPFARPTAPLTPASKPQPPSPRRDSSYTKKLLLDRR